MNKQNIFESITIKIKEKLTAGVLPWRKSWTVGIPMNFISKRPYNGINFLSLCLEDFPSPYYLTFLQCKQRDGLINKGASGNMIVYWKIQDLPVESSPPGSESVSRRVPLIRYSHVFNLSQTSLYRPNTEPSRIISCEDIIRKVNPLPVIKHNIRACYYIPREDYISIPVITDFDSPGEYYSSLFHELIHWTGHTSRLARLTGTKENTDHSFEELIAEIGSAYLCALSGISSKVLENQTSYINSWINTLEENKHLFVDAAKAAQKAVEYVLNITLSGGITSGGGDLFAEIM